MNTLYAIGIVLGRAFVGIMLGFCSIELFERSRGNTGPIHTGLTQRNPKIVLAGCFLLSLTGIYSMIVDLAGLLAS